MHQHSAHDQPVQSMLALPIECVVTPDHMATIRLPDAVAPGVHQVIVVIEHPAPAPLQRRPGSAKGRLIVLTEDDEHLQAFETHMP